MSVSISHWVERVKADDLAEPWEDFGVSPNENTGNSKLPRDCTLNGADDDSESSQSYGGDYPT